MSSSTTALRLAAVIVPPVILSLVVSIAVVVYYQARKVLRSRSDLSLDQDSNTIGRTDELADDHNGFKERSSRGRIVKDLESDQEKRSQSEINKNRSETLMKLQTNSIANSPDPDPVVYNSRTIRTVSLDSQGRRVLAKRVSASSDRLTETTPKVHKTKKVKKKFGIDETGDDEEEYLSDTTSTFGVGGEGDGQGGRPSSHRSHSLPPESPTIESTLSHQSFYCVDASPNHLRSSTWDVELDSPLSSIAASSFGQQFACPAIRPLKPSYTEPVAHSDHRFSIPIPSADAVVHRSLLRRFSLPTPAFFSTSPVLPSKHTPSMLFRSSADYPSPDVNVVEMNPFDYRRSSGFIATSCETQPEAKFVAAPTWIRRGVIEHQTVETSWGMLGAVNNSSTGSLVTHKKDQLVLLPTNPDKSEATSQNPSRTPSPLPPLVV